MNLNPHYVDSSETKFRFVKQHLRFKFYIHNNLIEKRDYNKLGQPSFLAETNKADCLPLQYRNTHKKKKHESKNACFKKSKDLHNI